MKNNKYSSEPSYESHKQEYEKLSNEEQMKTIQNPGHVDEAKWEKAKKISEESYGENKWPFVMWLYKEKLGGK